MRQFLLPCILLPIALIGQGRVGINTNTPQATLHVAGSVRIDSVPQSAYAQRIVVLDSLNTMRTISVDSFPKGSSPACYYTEAEAVASTSSSILQVRASLTLSPGTYLLTAYCEAYSSTIASGVRAQVNEGATELAYGALYSDQNTFSPWSMMRRVSIATPTTYTLLWASWPAGNISFIRRARLCAVRL